MLKKSVIVAIVAALLVSLAAVAIPRPAAAQVMGGFADELIFSVLDQPQAVASVSSGDTDIYIFSLDEATDKIAARDDPNINVLQAFSGWKGAELNPVAPADGTFNPFTIREIREAMHWAYDRDFIVNEIAGGFAIPMITYHHSAEVDYVRDAAFFAGLEARYSFDPARAKAQINSAMEQVQGASFDAGTGKWLMNGNPIVIKIIQRVEDFRREIGSYFGTVIDDLGFTADVQPHEFGPALDKVYFSDSSLGTWNMYTSGWGGAGFVQFNDVRVSRHYATFEFAPFDNYQPPASLLIPCRTLREGTYATLDERRDLLRTCAEGGMREGVRSNLQADTDVYAYNVGVTGVVFDLFGGNSNPWMTRSARLGGTTGGTLNIAQPIHTGSAWNIYGGHSDVYSGYQWRGMIDVGTTTHPHLGVVIPVRADFDITSVGPIDTMDVPSDALALNLTTNTFEQVGPGLESSAYVDFTFTWGEWHHGEMMSMDDILDSIAFWERMASGDLAAANPFNARQTALARWDTSFRGFEVLGPDSVRIWYNTFNPDESLIANRADVFPSHPWEINHVIAESVLAGDVAFSDLDADLLGDIELDLAKGVTLAALDIQLAASMPSVIPSHLVGNVTAAEATARWAALDAWRNNPAGCTNGPDTWTCNYYVSNGPYFLDTYFTAPEGAIYTAKRAGYPFEAGKWDFLTSVRIPEVAIGTPPEVIQTFPATFSFTTSLNQQPYDRIAQAAWIVSDPATRLPLFSGDAVRVGPGTWNAVLSADQTTALGEGSFELKTIVVGEEAASPVVTDLAFTSLSLSSAIITDLTVVIDTALTEFQDALDANTAATNAAVDSANAATNLANTVLIVAIVAILIAAVAVVLAFVWGGKGTT